MFGDGRPKPFRVKYRTALVLMALALIATSLTALAGTPAPQIARAQEALTPPETTVSQTLTFSTGNLSIGSIPMVGSVSVLLNYTIQATLSGPIAVLPGYSYTYYLTLSNPEVTVSVSINGQSSTGSVYAPLGQQVSVPVNDYVSVDVATSATAFIQVSGDASANPQTLQFPTEGTDNFTLAVSPALPGYSNVQVNVVVHLNLEITGISIVIYNVNFGPINIGSVTLQPKLQFTARRGYIVTFVEKGLPSGTPWGVSADGVTQYSTTNETYLLLPYGTTSFTVLSGSSDYVPVNGTGEINVLGPQVIYVSFTRQPKLSVSMGGALMNVQPPTYTYAVAAVIAVAAMAVGGVIIRKRG